jgi:predicted RNase H-like nuclease
MLYVGIDLAWGEKNTTAVVILSGSNDIKAGASLLAVEEALSTDSDILDFLKTHEKSADDGLLIGIDAPTLVPNNTGKRPCETILSSCLRRQEAGPHPANRTLLSGVDGTVRGERLVVALEEMGVVHTPYLNQLPHPPRAVFEVFPHPAHIALFGLEKTIKYKAKPGRTRETRVDEYRRYVRYLEGLATADPPLILPENTDAWHRQDPALLRPGALKRYEDALDALTCAYVALYRYRWGDARCPVVGNMTSGYIVTPATDAMQERFRSAAETLAAR